MKCLGVKNVPFAIPMKIQAKKKTWQGNNTLCLSAQATELLNVEPRAGQHMCMGGKKYPSSELSMAKIWQVEPGEGEDRSSLKWFV